MDAPKPDPRPRRSVAELAARVLKEPQDVLGNTRWPTLRIARNQTERAVLAPSITPFPDRLSIQAEPTTGGQHTVFDGVRDDGRALLDPEPIAWSNVVLSALPWHGTSLLPAILQQGSILR